MKKLSTILVMVITMLIIPLMSYSQIAKGTYSITPYFAYGPGVFKNYDPESKTIVSSERESEGNFGVGLSYFLFKNFEIGLDGFFFQDPYFYNGEKQLDIHWRVGPMIGYHLPVSKKFYLFARSSFTLKGSAFFSEFSSSSTSTSANLSFSAGFRYQFSDRFGLNLGLGPSIETGKSSNFSNLRNRNMTLKGNIGATFLVPSKRKNN